MATKHRGKAAQAAWAKKNGEKIAKARENYNIESAKREIELDAEYCAEKAKAQVGRPNELGDTKRVSINLTPEHVAIAKRIGKLIGNGSLSAGVRAALEAERERAPVARRVEIDSELVGLVPEVEALAARLGLAVR